MPVNLTCNFRKDPIKNKRYAPDKVKYGVFRHSSASNSVVNSLIWQEIKLLRDFMAVLVTCKFDEDPIKKEVATLRTTFSPL